MAREEITAQRERIREHVEEGRSDHRHLLGRELIERQPLTEDAAGREVCARRLEVLARVERAGAGLPGHEQVRHDHVEVLGRRAQEVPCVVEHQLAARVAVGAAVLGGEVVARRGGDARHDLHQRELLDARVHERGSGAAARGGAEERDAPWRGMQQQREMPLSLLMHGVGAAAERIVVVELDPALAPAFEHGDQTRRALLRERGAARLPRCAAAAA